MHKILVVGSKNTYRSIIVSEYLKKVLKDNAKTETEVLSAGIMAFPDIPAEPEAVEALAKSGITGEFKSHPLSKLAVAESFLILTMSEKIKNAILGKFPDIQSKTFTFAGYFTGTETDMTAAPEFADKAAAVINGNLSKFLSI